MLRKVCLLTLMAHIGSFVPARSATIPRTDKIFSRVGASDNLAQGESTFMVEMNETASILHNLSARSLIILDELGRGTSTGDGLALAQAIIEYLHDHSHHRAKTLLATHYHELPALTAQMSRVKNFHLAVKNIPDHVIFLYKLCPGPISQSFGVEVAKMAGIPQSIIQRAKDLLACFTPTQPTDTLIERIKQIPPPTPRQPTSSTDHPYKELIYQLKKVNVETISPVEALLKLDELKHLLDPHIV